VTEATAVTPITTGGASTEVTSAPAHAATPSAGIRRSGLATVA
jgi:hypothetical protein